MPFPGRNGSSSADSWRSEDTVKPSEEDKQRFAEESELSPGSRPSSRALETNSLAKSAIAPWDDAEPDPLDTSGSAVEAFPDPSWESSTSSRSGNNSGSFGGSFFPGDRSPNSPSFAPFMGRTDTLDTGFSGDDRRPSIASATTVSSNGSSHNMNRPMNKKLQGFFGEEVLMEQQNGSQGSLPPSAGTDENKRTTQSRNNGSSPGNFSPAQSSSEVTPWDFQDPQDAQDFGHTRSRTDSALGEREKEKEKLADRRQSTFPLKTSGHAHKFSLHRHRHQKSTDEQKRDDDSQQTAAQRHASLAVPRRDQLSARDMHSRSSISHWRSSSPSSRQNNNANQDTEDGKHGGDGSGGKKGFFSKIKNKIKEEKPDHEKLIKTPSLASLTQPQSAKTAKDSQSKSPLSSSSQTQNGGVQDDNASIHSTSRQSISQGTPKKDFRPHLPFKSKRGMSTEAASLKDANANKANHANHESYWDLDTNLDNMEGIVSGQPTVTTPSAQKSNPFASIEETPYESQDPFASQGGWDAPDSWAYRPAVDNVGRSYNADDDLAPEEEDSGVPYCIRIFRPDSTHATLSLPLNTTAAEIVQNLAKKSLLQDDLNNYQIIMRKHDTSRQLDSNERPVAIQKRLLEQAGYKESDHIDELGREDHSYLVRFNFLHNKMSGYASLERDPGFSKVQKLNNVDLSGHNLVTIPIALYRKCHEIISINLSRNLSLDVPKDFIQSCTALREIRFTGNEATRLPTSFALASKLTVLDISNNRFEHLDQTHLEKLDNLGSLKLSNNKLTSLPEYFTKFRMLRSLNISSNNLNELPTCIPEIATLVDLDVSFNMIPSLPDIGKLEHLERLWATNNRLSGPLEPSMSSLSNLREIDVRFNSIDNIDVCSQIPNLEHLMAGHNSISVFEGSFTKISSLYLDHNPVTRFGLEAATPTLSSLSLASAKLSQLPDDLFQKLSNITKLILDKNHFASLSPQLGRLQKLESLSIAKNSLSTLPPEIGRCADLRFLDARENNINVLPSEIWFCRKLETLNLSSNVLDGIPKPPTQIPSLADQTSSSSSTQAPTTPSEGDTEDSDKVGEFLPRRSSQVSNHLSNGASTGNSQRKSSTASSYSPNTRKPSVLARTPTDTASPMNRKDSMLMNRVTSTFIGSLKHVFLADNRISDDVFDQLSLLQELRIVNLSYNELYDVPPRTIRRWPNLTELYLSGNSLTSLPSEDLEEVTSLRVLHINNNKFQVLPAELGKIKGLAVLDASSNYLKYNVSNWPYDWNWNWNPNLKYLNISGNKRLEIKPASGHSSRSENHNLTDFSSLQKLRVLGLMDVTLMIPSVPDTTEDRRVRTSGSTIGTMAYGIADTLGRNDHLSTLDFIVPRLDGHEDETIFGLFEGHSQTNAGSRVVKFLQENFEIQFKLELKRKLTDETPAEALRRTYLALNKDLATLASQPLEAKERRMGLRCSVVTQNLNPDDLEYGCAATMMYLHGMQLYISNVGDTQAVLIKSEGGHKFITENHDPAGTKERQRIREAGGYVSRQGKLNDVLEVSRAFGFTKMMPAVVAAPHVAEMTIEESDEMILLASRELWDFLTPDFAVDLARSERNDLMRAAQKLRDLAIAFGASGKITVMVIGVSDLRRKERARYRTHSMSMGPSGLPDEYQRRGKRGRDATLDSKLARLDQEVDAPVGDVSLVFTDIKNSTLLWETYPIAMRSAIKMHNEVMRRHLRLIGGYEVKTEGDAFMVAFPTVTSALLWCFTIQSHLLEVQWPQEILNSVNGQEVADSDGNVLFRGLSVRMGIHWGQPVCETDPVTRRMDYFGPMVNRAARISAVADGGQITVSTDFIAEIQRLLETHMETDRTNSTGSEEQMNDDALNAAIRRELRSLHSHGFAVKDLGERRLKGLENPEYIYLMYPHSLSGRLRIQQQRAEAEKASSEGVSAKTADSQLTVDLDCVWDLWAISLRLEMLCSALECPESGKLKAPETALLERTKERGGEVTDRFVVNFIEHQISRIETCITSLAIRNLLRPFKNGMLEQSCPMADIFSELTEQLAELRTFKEQNDIDIAPS